MADAMPYLPLLLQRREIIVGGLGYRGFSVSSVRERLLDPHIYLHAGIVDQDRFDSNRTADNSDLETWLLGTAGKSVETDIAKFVESELTGRPKNITPATAPSFSTLSVPP